MGKMDFGIAKMAFVIKVMFVVAIKVRNTAAVSLVQPYGLTHIGQDFFMRNYYRN